MAGNGAERPRGETGTVILDLDGTLVDSAPDIADALDELLVERGLAPIGLAGTRRLIGHGIANLVRKGLSERGLTLSQEELGEATARFQVHYSSRLPVRAIAYPGVTNGLRALQSAGWRLVVCTNKLERFSRAILAGLGLDAFFDIIAGPDTFGVAKPDPQHLLRALPANRRPGYQVVMVGDSEVDVAVAKAAAIPVIAVTYGYAHVDLASLAPEALAQSFADVPALVARIAAASAPAASLATPHSSAALPHVSTGRNRS